jgi:hypothetical protein
MGCAPRLRTDADFRVERGPDGRWHTYRPDGAEILLDRSELLVSV